MVGMKILYVLKKNLIYGGYNSVIARSGLLNSARLTSDQLKKYLHVDTAIEICVDGNEIDKFIHKHKPALCIIEAIWVTPKKMKELSELHPCITFIVLIHSEVPFLAGEGNAISWIYKYNQLDRVYPAFNSRTTYDQFRALGIVCYYLPNVYLDVKERHHRRPVDGVLNIASFGAIRPFKNQLIQAMAAIVFAEKHGKRLHFHMNTTRTEQGGEGVLKNIRALFDATKHSLVEHGWKDREGFLHLCAKMDLGLQLSFSESFNIVTADFVNAGTPIVVSNTIDWMPGSQKASVDDMENILEIMEHSFHNRQRAAERSARFLNRYNKKSLKVWQQFLSGY